jgi:hypothetical protein
LANHIHLYSTMQKVCYSNLYHNTMKISMIYIIKTLNVFKHYTWLEIILQLTSEVHGRYICWSWNSQVLWLVKFFATKFYWQKCCISDWASLVFYSYENWCFQGEGKSWKISSRSGNSFCLSSDNFCNIPFLPSSTYKKEIFGMCHW